MERTTNGFTPTTQGFGEETGMAVITQEQQLAIIKAETGLIGKLTGTGESYCTFKPETPEQKVALYNAMSDPDKILKECINMEIKVKDVFCEVVYLESERTGMIEECPRIVLIDTDDVSYQCVSTGVYHSLKALFQIYGEPTWKDGITVIPFLKAIKGNRSVLTLQLPKAKKK
jgi:hypothetical protein